MKKIKRILVILIVFALIIVFNSCQNSTGNEIKRINLFHIKYYPNENITNDEVYPKDPPSYIYYRKYYIYFYDNNSKTLYKYSRNGNAVLTIQNSSITTSGFGIDKEKIMSNLDENQRSLKIIRSFPLPEITGISVDFNDNIYLKVVIKGTSGNAKEDCSGFLSNYSDNDHPIYYLFDDDNSLKIKEKLESFEELISRKNEEIQIKYYTFYMVFNPYGDFLKVIALSKNYLSFPHNSFISHTKEDLAEGTNKDGKKIDGTNYIYFILPTIYENSGMPSALANKVSSTCIIKFSLKPKEEVANIINLPQEMNLFSDKEKLEKGENDLILPDGEENQEGEGLANYQYQFCQNSRYITFDITELLIPENNKSNLGSEFGSIIISPDGFIGFQVYYYEKGYILYDAIYKIEILDKKTKINLYYYKKLFNEKTEEGVQKITLSVADTFIGSAEGNFLFYVRYLEKLPTPSAKLIIKNDKGESLITRLLKVKDILNTENLIVGENGSIYGFTKIKSNVYFFYYASEVAISKLKTSN